MELCWYFLWMLANLLSFGRRATDNPLGLGATGSLTLFCLGWRWFSCSPATSDGESHAVLPGQRGVYVMFNWGVSRSITPGNRSITQCLPRLWGVSHSVEWELHAVLSEAKGSLTLHRLRQRTFYKALSTSADNEFFPNERNILSLDM